MAQSCKTCRFWMDTETSAHDPIGLCRRRPPRIIETLFKDREKWSTDELVAGASEFPITPGWQWCGKFEPMMPKL